MTISLALLLAFQAVPALAVPTPTLVEASASGGDALLAVTKSLCDKDIALLGEGPTHGDGRTDAFKVELVQQLVKECHYNAVFFEASHYEFIALNRRLRLSEPVTEEIVASAIGGLWKFDREFQPLIPFLAKEASSGRLTLGGLDGQLGGFQQTYANDEMPSELTNFLEADRRLQCQAILKQRIYWAFTDAASYSEGVKSQIQKCAADIREALGAKAEDSPLRTEQLEMVENIERFTSADLMTRADQVQQRDRDMFLNFQWLSRKLPAHSKIIVWAATVHIAKDVSATPPFSGIRNLGSFVRETYGPRSFALGFSAYEGSYRVSSKTERVLPPAPPNSLEAKSIEKTSAEAVYVDPGRLTRFGAIPGAALRHEYQALRWSDVLDGVVVFRREFPAHSTRP